jgi:hypothetical protein
MNQALGAKTFVEINNWQSGMVETGNLEKISMDLGEEVPTSTKSKQWNLHL